MTKKIYFMGIAGTGMGAAAGLLKQAGYTIVGSDQVIYPPMSTMLENLQISVLTPYSKENLISQNPDLVVIANALSRGNSEIEYVLENNIPYSSFPALIGEKILAQRESIVVCGTHGKTTTTALLAHCLRSLGVDTGYLIGGIPKGHEKSFNIGTAAPFVIEGDEYDTAFFDKGPKFLHYRPKFLIVNNIEYDHADIYKNVEEIYQQFRKLLLLVPNTYNIIANVDDFGVNKVLTDMGMIDKVTKVATKGLNRDAADFWVSDHGFNTELQIWQAQLNSRQPISPLIKTPLSGSHNMANIAMAFACLRRLELENVISPQHVSHIVEIIAGFEGVQRRLDLLVQTPGITVYEDFAHHPSAVALVIESLRQIHREKKLIACFEPRNASARRSVFLEGFAASLGLADEVYVGACFNDQRIPTELRMDTNKMAELIGPKARAFTNNSELLAALKAGVKPGTVVLFMSSGSFDGIQHQFAEFLKKEAGGS